MANSRTADNDSFTKMDKYGKLRLLFDVLNINYLQNTKSMERHSIDKAMLPCFDCHGYKQFIKVKPIRLAYKL